MTPGEAQDVRFAASVAAAYLRGDSDQVNALVVQRGEAAFSTVADAFVLLSLTAATQLAMLTGSMLEKVLSALPESSEMLVPVGGLIQREDVVALTIARDRSPNAARAMSSALLDVPTAVNSAFDLGITALRQLERETGTPAAEWADIYVAGIDRGEGVDPAD